MRALWLKCCRNNDKPDLITADNEAYGHFWASMTERQRFTGSTGKMAKVRLAVDDVQHGGSRAGRWNRGLVS